MKSNTLQKKKWFFTSPIGFILGLIILAYLTAAFYLLLFDSHIGIVGGLIGGAIGASYLSIYNKCQKTFFQNND